MALQLHLSSSTEKTVSSGSEPSNKDSRRRLLIVDDEQMLLEVLAAIFDETYDLRTASSGDEALKVIQSGFHPEVIIADQRMPNMSGAQFLARSIDVLPGAVRVVLTGYTDVQDIIDSINLGNVYRFMTKPWQRDEIQEAVRLCFEHYDMLSRHAELEEAHRNLAEAHLALKAMTDEKDEFLGIAAHDLKNPIGGIRGLAEILLQYRETIDEGQTNEMLESIINSSDRMFELITNLLDVNMLERGGMRLHPIPFDIGMQVQEIVEMYGQRAEAKSIRLHYEYHEGLTVFADEPASMQVLDNLISNAVKYSPKDKNVHMRLHEVSSAEAQIASASGAIRIEVQDEGPGLSEEDMKKLFGKFARLSARPTGDEHSTGLGLSIVKKIVEEMNGRVWCESELGKGAMFVVVLPKAGAEIE